MIVDFFGMPDPSTAHGRACIVWNAIVTGLIVLWCVHGHFSK